MIIYEILWLSIHVENKCLLMIVNQIVLFNDTVEFEVKLTGDADKSMQVLSELHWDCISG